MKILKAAAKALEEKAFFESQIYISVDVLKLVRNNRAKQQKDYFKEIKEKEDVESAFIPWSVPWSDIIQESFHYKVVNL